MSHHHPSTNGVSLANKASVNLNKLPRTGIDQPYMAVAPQFKEAHREFERIATVNTQLIAKLEHEELTNETS